MNIYITLDYELYFGAKSGTAQKSIIEPTEALINIADKHAVKLVFFVDVGYLIKLDQFKSKDAHIAKEHEIVFEQVAHLANSGHDIQLHIHPHWEDSYYEKGKWHIDTSKYKLSDFDEEEIMRIVTTYKNYLERTTNKPVFAFRAGGWCIQPFSKVMRALKENGVWLDSTVFYGGHNASKTHYFDFKRAPKKDYWKFEKDPLKINTDGYFTEIPITSKRLSPLFFWKLAFTKKMGGPLHKSFGDGTAAGGSKKDKLRMLAQLSNSVVSIDGYKASYLKSAYQKAKSKNRSHFVVIGHPKALTPYSLRKLDEFLAQIKNDNVITFKDYSKNEV
jgi:hypothetical protein